MSTPLHNPAELVTWLRAQGATDIVPDSRQLTPGAAFIAWPGAATDGRRFVRAALAQGAVACVVEDHGLESLADWPLDAPVARFEGLKAATGPLAAQWFEHPSEQLELLAITGTNGKTSTAWWLAQALSNLPAGLAQPCAMVGTLGVGRVPAPGAVDPLAQVSGTGMTTPDPVLLQRQLRSFVNQGLKACAIEASSIGLAEHRAQPPDHEDGQRQELLRLLRVEFEHAGLSRLQIDFEATASQRAFYRGLIFELRAALGARVFLSVTALASWCLQDRFMTDWPVDEIVPMFYRLGSEGPKLRDELQRGVDLAPECRRAHGLYTDEPMILPPVPRRLYLFSRAAFSEASLDRARGRLAASEQDTR